MTATYHHGDLRSALLRAVEVLVAEKGAREFSLREAARRAGVSHSAPSHHFGDKEGLLAAFAAEGFLGLTAAFGEVPVGSDPLDDLRRCGRTYVEFCIAHPAHFDVMFRCGLDKAETDELAGAGLAAFQALLDRIERAQSAGHGTHLATEELAVYFWSGVHGLASLVIDGTFGTVLGDSVSLDTAIGRLADLQVLGLVHAAELDG